MTAKGLENFFQRGRAGEKGASGSTAQHCPLQTTETKMPASPEENRSFLLGYVAEILWGMPLRTRERKGTSRRGPGKPPLDRASSARLAHRTTARRARSQDVEEDPELLRAGSGPAPGSSEVSASLPACVCWGFLPETVWNSALRDPIRDVPVLSNLTQQDGWGHYYFGSLPCPLLCQSTQD